MTRAACYHGRAGRLPLGTGRYGQRVTVEVLAPRGTHPRNALVQFADGARQVTSVGCLRWSCDKHAEVTP